MIRTDDKHCPWCWYNEKPLSNCQVEWTVFDDDFGQFVAIGMIRYCFACGRKLTEGD